MNQKIFYTLFISVCFFIVGCSNQASFSERAQDNFAFTSASSVPFEQIKCIRLTKPYQLKTSMFTHTFPAGIYMGKKQNKTGVFYYSNASINASLWAMGENGDGIYLNNNGKNGNFFGHTAQGFDDRPVRGIVLPGEILQNIKMNVNCNGLHS